MTSARDSEGLSDNESCSALFVYQEEKYHIHTRIRSAKMDAEMIQTLLILPVEIWWTRVTSG